MTICILAFPIDGQARNQLRESQVFYLLLMCDPRYNTHASHVHGGHERTDCEHVDS